MTKKQKRYWIRQCDIAESIREGVAGGHFLDVREFDGTDAESLGPVNKCDGGYMTASGTGPWPTIEAAFISIPELLVINDGELNNDCNTRRTDKIYSIQS